MHFQNVFFHPGLGITPVCGRDIVFVTTARCSCRSGRTSSNADPAIYQNAQRHFASPFADLLLVPRPAVEPHNVKLVYSANTLSVLLTDVCILKKRWRNLSNNLCSKLKILMGHAMMINEVEQSDERFLDKLDFLSLLHTHTQNPLVSSFPYP